MTRQELGTVPDRARLLLGGIAIAAAGVLTATVIVRDDAGLVTATIPAGTRLVGSMDRSISTDWLAPGDPVRLRTFQPIELSNDVTLPAGIEIHGEVTHAQGGGRIAGAPALTIRFRALEVQGVRYEIETEPFRVRGKDDLGESVALIGGGAVAGGVVGAVAGHTLAGAAAGAVLGTGAAIATRGDQITLAAGQRLRVRLAAPVEVRFRPAPAGSNAP